MAKKVTKSKKAAMTTKPKAGGAKKPAVRSGGGTKTKK